MDGQEITTHADGSIASAWDPYSGLSAYFYTDGSFDIYLSDCGSINFMVGVDAAPVVTEGSCAGEDEFFYTLYGMIYALEDGTYTGNDVYQQLLGATQDGVAVGVDSADGSTTTYTWEGMTHSITVDNTDQSLVAAAPTEFLYATFHADGTFIITTPDCMMIEGDASGNVISSYLMDCQYHYSPLEVIEWTIMGLESGLTTISDLTSELQNVLVLAIDTVTDDVTGSTTYTFEDGEVITVDVDGNISGNASDAGIHASFNVDGTWWIEMLHDCMYLSGDSAGMTSETIAGCVPDMGDLMNLIVSELDQVMQSSTPDVSGLIGALQAATQDAGATAEPLYGWDYVNDVDAVVGTMYTFEDGSYIDIYDDGNIMAYAGWESDLWGNFYADGTWDITVGCNVMEFDGTNYHEYPIYGCDDSEDTAFDYAFEAVMENLQYAIYNVAYANASMSDITDLLNEIINYPDTISDESVAGQVTYSWADNDASITVFDSGVIAGAVPSYGIVGEWDTTANTWWLEDTWHCERYDGTTTGVAVTALADCAGDPSDITNMLVAAIDTLIDGTGDAYTILALFETAMQDSGVYVEDAIDGSTHYYWDSGEYINVDADGNYMAASPELNLFGTFYTDGTWMIDMFEHCLHVSSDGTTVSTETIANCNPGGYDDLMEIILTEIYYVMDGGDPAGLLAAMAAAPQQADTVTDMTDHIQYSWDDGKVISVYTDGSITASAPDYGLYGNFHADGTFVIDYTWDCVMIEYDGTNVLVNDLASCVVEEGVDILGSIMIAVADIPFSGNIDALISMFEAATLDADSEVTVADGSVIYSWNEGHQITYEGDMIYASSTMENIYADIDTVNGTFYIALYNECMYMQYDGSGSVIYENLEGCIPYGADVLQLIQWEIEALASSSDGDATALIDLLHAATAEAIAWEDVGDCSADPSTCWTEYIFEGGESITIDGNGVVTASAPDLGLEGEFTSATEWYIDSLANCTTYTMATNSFTEEAMFACIPYGYNVIDLMQYEISGMIVGEHGIDGFYSAVYAAIADPEVIATDMDDGSTVYTWDGEGYEIRVFADGSVSGFAPDMFEAVINADMSYHFMLYDGCHIIESDSNGDPVFTIGVCQTADTLMESVSVAIDELATSLDTTNLLAVLDEFVTWKVYEGVEEVTDGTSYTWTDGSYITYFDNGDVEAANPTLNFFGTMYANGYFEIATPYGDVMVYDDTGFTFEIAPSDTLVAIQAEVDKFIGGSNAAKTLYKILQSAISGAANDPRVTIEDSDDGTWYWVDNGEYLHVDVDGAMEMYDPQSGLWGIMYSNKSYRIEDPSGAVITSDSRGNPVVTQVDLNTVVSDLSGAITDLVSGDIMT